MNSLGSCKWLSGATAAASLSLASFLLLTKIALVSAAETRCFYGDYSTGNLLEQRVKMVDSRESLEASLRGENSKQKEGEKQYSM